MITARGESRGRNEDKVMAESMINVKYAKPSQHCLQIGKDLRLTRLDAYYFFVLTTSSDKKGYERYYVVESNNLLSVL